MAEQNVCRYVPREMSEHSIHTVNFVLETEQQVYSGLRLKALYTMYLVIQGKGRLHTQGVVRELKEGDLFFTFPAVPVAIESVDSFQYMYISFLGARGNQLMEKLGVSPHSFVFTDCGEITPVWMLGINCPAELSDIASRARQRTARRFVGRNVELVVEDERKLTGWTGEYFFCKITNGNRAHVRRKDLVRARVLEARNDLLSAIML